MPINSGLVYGCFPAKVAELNNYNSGLLAIKLKILRIWPFAEVF
jgi:hypothetical protein